ncbi:hypothetical protein CIG75_00925 [Tumebacillus algifaecis]|uniref:Uncharacterized protein n=1 Tax=Tumebacillus algifaecis TaxID=1214604 RepID=A0A223CWI2_9BACL|nr:hypothetical protein [Tumebacillus algifaecis]ASS73678.1 hypothetical protein CIG75_00925 [Tumebacillus algifaecis]
MFQPPTQAPGSQGPVSAQLPIRSEQQTQDVTDRRSPKAGVGSLSAGQILQLQKTVGNRAVTQMLKQQVAQQQEKDSSSPQATDEMMATGGTARSLLEDEILDLGSTMFTNLKTDYLYPQLIKSGVKFLVESFMKATETFLAVDLNDPSSDVKKVFTLMLSALGTFRQLVNTWINLNPNLKAGIKYIVGVMIHKFDSYTSKYLTKEFLPHFESFAADDVESAQWAQDFFYYFNIVESYVGYTDIIKNTTNMMLKWFGYQTTDQSEATTETTAETADAQSSAAPASKSPAEGTSIDLKLIKLDLQKLTIAKTEDQTQHKDKKLGGLDSKSSVTVRLFGNEYKVDEIHARLNWNLELSVDVSFLDKTIVDHSSFLIFDIERLILNKLTVGNKGLDELVVSIGKFKAGSLLEIDQISGGYQKGKGYKFGVGAMNLHLPSPFDTSIKAGAELNLDPDGGFHSFEVNNFQVGKSLSMERALLNKEYLHIQELVFDLNKYNIPLKPVLKDLLVTKDKKIKSLQGGVSVQDLEVLEGLIISGEATVGYDGVFFIQVAGAKILLDQKFVSGYGAIKKLRYNTDRTLEGEIEELAFSVGVFSFAAQDVIINKDGSLSIAEAGVVLGKQDKVSSADLDKMSQGGGKESLKRSLGAKEKSSSFSSPVSVHLKAKGITIKDGNVEVQEYEKWIGPSKVYKISLFGGAIQGMVDQEEEKARIYGRFSFPKNLGFWPIKIGASMPIPPTPLSLFAEVGIGGGFTAQVAGEVAKDRSLPEESVYDVRALAQLDAFLNFSVGAGIQLGHDFLIAVKAYLQASAQINASTSAELSGRVRWNPDTQKLEQDKSKPVQLEYEIDAELTAKIEALLDFVAFVIFRKTLFSKTLGSWTLGKYHMSGVVGEKKGKLTDQIDTPNRKGSEEGTLGGAIPGKIKLPEKKVVDDLVQGHEIMKNLKEKTSDERKLYRAAHDLLSLEADLDQEKSQEVQERIRSVAKKPEKVDGLVDKAHKYISSRSDGERKSYLMTKEEWIEYSDLGSKRTSITVVDSLLETYHQEADPSKKLELLEELRKHLNKYLKEFGKGRKPMVMRLLIDTNKEEELLKNLSVPAASSSL